MLNVRWLEARHPKSPLSRGARGLPSFSRLRAQTSALSSVCTVSLPLITLVSFL